MYKLILLDSSGSLEPANPPSSARPPLSARQEGGPEAQVIAGKRLRVRKMNQLMLLGCFKAFGDNAIPRSRRAYFCSRRLSILPM